MSSEDKEIPDYELIIMTSFSEWMKWYINAALAVLCCGRNNKEMTK